MPLELFLLQWVNGNIAGRVLSSVESGGSDYLGAFLKVIAHAGRVRIEVNVIALLISGIDQHQQSSMYVEV